MLAGYEDVARLHISFSGTLLKQFEDPAIRETFHDVVDREDLLGRYRWSNIEFVGTALYHPVYPLIPATDWDAHTSWWIGLGKHLLGRDTFQGFWPPEMGFWGYFYHPILDRYRQGTLGFIPIHSEREATLIYKYDANFRY